MGDQAVVVTGVLGRDGDVFKTQYEIRRFKVGKSVFCISCGPQPGDPPAGHYDLADGTLRCRFDPADYETPVDSFVSYDVVPLESDSMEMFRFDREGFHVGAREFHWDYEVGSLFHLVLPPKHLPIPEAKFFESQPRYGWRLGDRFVVGWQRSLLFKCTFTFGRVAPEVFGQQAEQLRRRIKDLPQEPMPPVGRVQVDHGQPLTSLQRRQLREKIAASFDVRELATLCFDMNIEYQNLPDEGKEAKVIELIAYCERRGRISELTEKCREERPNIQWE